MRNRTSWLVALVGVATIGMAAITTDLLPLEPSPTLPSETFLEARLTIGTTSAPSPVAVSFYLQHVTSGHVYYYVPATEVSVTKIGPQRFFRAWVFPEDLEGLDVDYSTMRWAARVDARSESVATTVDSLLVEDFSNGHLSFTLGPLFAVEGEVFWVIDTHFGDLLQPLLSEPVVSEPIMSTDVMLY